MINLTVPAPESDLIIRITRRAASLINFGAYGNSTLTASMDITACHANGCALDLPALLAADDADLIHDVTGIFANINRQNGKLEHCFLPRYARVFHKA